MWPDKGNKAPLCSLSGLRREGEWGEKGREERRKGEGLNFDDVVFSVFFTMDYHKKNLIWGP